LEDDPAINLQVPALLADMRWRSDRLATALGRLDARAACASCCSMFSSGYAETD
jgi:hypothetical protein